MFVVILLCRALCDQSSLICFMCCTCFKQLTPDENLKFGGAKGGNKYSDETCDVVSESAVLGKLSLATIDSVIQDLHRLGCKRKVCQMQRRLPYHREHTVSSQRFIYPL
jgi:hypothetical protein